METKRGQWGSTFGFLMAAVGSAVGLGNIWGFPYKMGANGGFAFLILYLILAVFVGFVAMIAELSLGRKTGKGVIATYQTLSKKFGWIGWMGALSPFLIMTFYSVLGAYCIKYAVVNLGDLFGAGFGSAGLSGAEVFGNMITNQVEAVIYTAIFMVLTCVIVMGGIKGGIEKFTSFAMPALFVMLCVVIIRSVTLPGAVEGIKFMFAPNFAPFKENFMGVLATAGGQMFFSLSLGMGAMVTYGSYLSKDENIERNALLVVVSDTIVALMAGLAVLPAAFALGGEGAAMSGPKLLFVTLQDVFGAMGAVGPLFGLIFYILVFIAAITSSISLVEVITAHFMDQASKKGEDGSRTKYTVIACVAIMVLAAIVAADGLGSNGLPQPMGFCWLDFMDLWSEGIMMPLGVMLMALCIGYEIKVSSVENEITQNGNQFTTKAFFTFCIKYVVPLAMVLVLAGQIDGFFGLGLFG
ncbi:MAG: sodium-dependent transporter [Oscillospiraceae bacterium]|nr:sodium-dependent transporter [Oscillospiraceae bacterium]